VADGGGEGEGVSGAASAVARPAGVVRARSKRRFAVGSATGIALALPVLSWMVNLGNWDFVQRGFFTDFYDVQARALVHGHWNMPPQVLGIEAFVVHGRSYMYFGPFPSFLRLPVLLATSSLDGRLTQLSMLLAFTIALVCSARLSWKIRALVTSSPVTRVEAVIVGVSMAVIGIGSVFIFLAGQAVVYHEAEAWGAALAIAAFDALVSFLVRPSNGRIALTGAFATFALLTRASVGLGPVAALGLLAVVHAVAAARRHGQRWRSRPDHPAPQGVRSLAWLGIPDSAPGTTRTIALAVATVVALGCFAWVNDAKFGTLFSVPFSTQLAVSDYPAVKAVIHANGGTFLRLKYVPTGLLQYLRPDALRFTRLYPFVSFPPPATLVGHVAYATRLPASSVTSTMPAFTVAGAIGVWAVFRSRRRRRTRRDERPQPDLAVLRIPVLAAGVGIVGSLEIAYVAHRYLADWMPLLVLVGLAGLTVLVERARTMARWTRRSMVAVGCVLAAFGVLSNLALAILYQRELNWSTPTSARAQFVSLREHVDRSLFGSPAHHVVRVAGLPAVAPAGTLAVVGNCAALYQSGGDKWDAVEQSAAAGHYRLRVTFASLPRHNVHWPLVVTGSRGAGDIVGVRRVGPDEVSLGYLYQAPPFALWIAGPTVHIVPGRAIVVDVVEDPNIREVVIDGLIVVPPGGLVRPPTQVTFGVDRIAAPTARAFGGTVVSLPTPTPICESLRRTAQGR